MSEQIQDSQFDNNMQGPQIVPEANMPITCVDGECADEFDCEPLPPQPSPPIAYDEPAIPNSEWFVMTGKAVDVINEGMDKQATCITAISSDMAVARDDIKAIRADLTTYIKSNIPLQKIQQYICSQNEQLQKALFGQLKLPIMKSIAELYRDCVELNPDGTNDSLSSIQSSIEDLLEQYGAEVHQTPVGENYRPRFADVRIRPTADQKLHKLVARSIRPGYVLRLTIENGLTQENVLLRELIEVYKYEPSMEVKPVEPEPPKPTITDSVYGIDLGSTCANQ